MNRYLYQEITTLIWRILRHQCTCRTHHATVAGERPYTPHYASPEQVRGEPVGTATDIYSLGVLLYLMLTGQRPYGRSATSAAEAARCVLEEPPVRPSVDQGQVGWVFRPLALEPMAQAAQALLGEHDFSSFRAARCQAHSPVKRLMRLDISRRGSYWRFEFEASAFLHHMIRNIMGCLIAIGSGSRPAAWMTEVLRARSRDAAAPTFSPDGLYFLGPVYDAGLALPERTPAFDWLP